MRDFHVPSYLLTLKLFDGRCLLEDTQTQHNPGWGNELLTIAEVNGISQMLSLLIIDFLDRYSYL